MAPRGREPEHGLFQDLIRARREGEACVQTWLSIPCCRSPFSCPQLDVGAGPAGGVELRSQQTPPLPPFQEAPRGVIKKGPAALWKPVLPLDDWAFFVLRAPRCLSALPFPQREVTCFSGKGRKLAQGGHSEDGPLLMSQVPRSRDKRKGHEHPGPICWFYITPYSDNDQCLQTSG